MNGLERILETVAFRRTDRLPAIPLVFGHAAVLANIRLVDYLRDGTLLARCQLAALDRYGHDAVYAFMDAGLEIEAIGSRLRYHDDLYPDVESYLLKPGDDPFRLKMPDPEKDGRMPELLKAASLMRKEAGDRVLVVGVVLGPMSLATQLIGIEAALYFAADHPGGFERVLDYATEVAIRHGLVQLRAGVHVPLVFDASASPAVVPAAFFREFLLPRFKRIFAALQSAGAPRWLNIAGPTLSIMPYYPEIGVDIVSFDYQISAAEAQRHLPDTCLAGNLKPLDFTLGSPENIFHEATQLRVAFAKRGGFLLSSGCEIPPEAKPENIDAMIAACSEA